MSDAVALWGMNHTHRGRRLASLTEASDVTYPTTANFRTDLLRCRHTVRHNTDTVRHPSKAVPPTACAGPKCLGFRQLALFRNRPTGTALATLQRGGRASCLPM